MKARQDAGLVVIRRINWFDDPALSLGPTKRVSAIPASDSEILSTYRGIEGYAWPDSPDRPAIEFGNGLVAVSLIDQVERYYSSVSEKWICDLLFCRVGEQPAALRELPTFMFCGFDYGTAVVDSFCFSAVFNDVIYGAHEELRSFATSLNAQLLFMSREDLGRFAAARTALLMRGAALEAEDEPLEITAVFGKPSRRGGGPIVRL